MELNRRRFFWLLLTGLTGLTALPWRRWLAGLTPRRVVTALRGRHYPGNVDALKEEDVAEPGTWAG